MPLKVLLVTHAFPYLNSETFLWDELGYLCQKHEIEVTVVPLFAAAQSGSTVPQSLPSRCHLRALPARKLSWQERLRLLADTDLYLAWLANLPRLDWRQGRFLWQYLLASKAAFQRLCSEVEVHTFDLIYSYWLDRGAMVVRECKRHHPDLVAVSRAHGFDLYSELNQWRHRPYHQELLQSLDAVFPCSEFGTAYLKRKYPTLANKIITMHLGVVEQSPTVHPNPQTQSGLYLLSCANAIPLKRLELVLEALKRVKRPIRWQHIGTGPNLESLKTAAKQLPEHVHCTFSGALDHTALLQEMAEKPIDYLISLSASEGLPVSMMEAMSFGIPVIATDVGGCAEIVHHQTNGYLVDATNPLDSFVALLSTLAPPSTAMRQAALLTQRQDFHVAKNTERMVQRWQTLSTRRGAAHV